ncbi:MAG: ScyD/ScyE family protein [Anaerolineae bacterium]|nr:ScyD/ScyE family protein [Anaerolineae bacterium]
MRIQRKIILLILCCVLTLSVSLAVNAQPQSGNLDVTLLVSGLDGGSGSTIGPDGALYIPENDTGRISRVDPVTGDVTMFASGLPQVITDNGVGGIMDLAFMNDTAYALVTLVGEDVGGTDVAGIYRIDDEGSFTVIADIGQYSIDNPPEPNFFVPSGAQYSMAVYGSDFQVADGQHNRVLRVTLDGDISEVIAFDNVVPTGLEVSASSSTIYMTEAGPVPHLAENGKVMAFEPGSSATEIASGARLLVDVEYGCCGTLYALAQGEFSEGNAEGSPADPNTGSMVKVNADGTFSVLVDGLNQPTSFETIGNTAYVITLNGEIWKIDGVSA